MKTVLITAYAVNPFKGSEDGTGWNISKEIAKKNKVILITRKNNIPHLDRYKELCTNNDMDSIEFHGFDLPQWVLNIKKRSGDRGYVLYFYFWQIFVALFIKKQQFTFDIAHCLNFHSDSHANFLWMLGKPTFWGPVGHHPKVPKGFILGTYGIKSFLRDRVYNAVKWCMRNLDPFYYLAVRNSQMIFGINSSIEKKMGVKAEKFKIVPAVASPTNPSIWKPNKGFNILMVGRFHYMKGFDIAIKSFAKFYHALSSENQNNTVLTLVGKGPEKQRLIAIAKSAKIYDQIEWIEWVNLTEMKGIYSKASVFLFPSHEGAGMVVPEAMSHGVPVICFDNVGPGELAGNTGIKVSYDQYDKVVSNFSIALDLCFTRKSSLEHMSKKSIERHQEIFTWENKAQIIMNEYYKIGKQTEVKKSIAVFHPSSELYGADRIMVNALKAIPKNITKMVYLKSDGPLVQFLEKEVENVEVIVKLDMPIIYRKIFTPKGVLKFIYDWFTFHRFIRKEHEKHQFVSAYVNTLSASFILPILKQKKIINYIHVHEIVENPRIIGKLTAELCLRFASKIVCVSQAVSKNLNLYSKKIRSKSVVLHNGIEQIDCAPMDQEDGTKFFLFGRLMPKKGQWYLLDALATIPKAKLGKSKFILMGGVLMGREELLDDLHDKINDLDLQDHIEIRDFAPNIETAMSEADVCLVPSMMKDPFPTTVLEAMSAGRPVIATNHGGAKEAIINGVTGILVSPGDIKDLARHIINMIGSKLYLKKLGINAKSQFNDKFTISVFNKNWIKFNLQNEFI